MSNPEIQRFKEMSNSPDWKLMYNVLIREAHEGDFSAIGNLIKNELGYSDLGFTALFDRLRLIESSSSYKTYVAVNDTKIVGFIGLLRYITYERDYECLRILAMAVSQEQQSKGIGSKLLRKAEQFAVESNISNVMVTSNMKRSDAHKFYERNDYVKKSYGFFKTI